MPSELTNLVLEQHTKRLNDLKLDIVRQTAYIVMALDNGGVARAALYNIGIDCSLHKIIHSAELFGFFLKNSDEFFADYLPLALRVADAAEL